MITEGVRLWCSQGEWRTSRLSHDTQIRRCLKRRDVFRLLVIIWPSTKTIKNLGDAKHFQSPVMVTSRGLSYLEVFRCHVLFALFVITVNPFSEMKPCNFTCFKSSRLPTTHTFKCADHYPWILILTLLKLMMTYLPYTALFSGFP